MSVAPVASKVAVISAGEPTLFDSLARLVAIQLAGCLTTRRKIQGHNQHLVSDEDSSRSFQKDAGFNKGSLQTAAVICSGDALHHQSLLFSVGCFRWICK